MFSLESRGLYISKNIFMREPLLLCRCHVHRTSTCTLLCPRLDGMAYLSEGTTVLIFLHVCIPTRSVVQPRSTKWDARRPLTMNPALYSTA